MRRPLPVQCRFCSDCFIAKNEEELIAVLREHQAQCPQRPPEADPNEVRMEL